MTINFEKMCTWEKEKANFLCRQIILENLPLQDAIIDINHNSGYVYYYHEFIPVSFFMPINCELIREDIMALYSDPWDGNESEISLEDLKKAPGTNLEEKINYWVSNL